ncbi:hypothetical protein [Streptomyces sp. NRRL B-24572]|uniref:hypothetical protein n=1 Tax=Streptomyces sp. NRRL B-24572 TaxID=1962156 RepID=UPI001180261F|nr:hypothetical protein [Streptomyces sp. NRRL B-24572]
MSTPPESPSTDRLVREAVGLLLAAIGALVVLFSLGRIHPVLGSTVTTAAALSLSYFILRNRGRRGRIAAWVLTGVTSTASVVTAFLYASPLAWVEIGAAAVAVGAWLASEGA